MLIDVLSYKIMSNGDIPIQFYEIQNCDEDIYIEQLKKAISLKAFDINEVSVKVLDNGVVNYEKNVIVYPTLGLNMHISKLVNDNRYGNVVSSKPVDLKYWLED